MKPWVRKVILVCLFAAIIIYMGLQIPYRNQSLTFNKNAALFDSVMQQVSGHLTENGKRLLRQLYVRDDICRMANVGAMLPYMNYAPKTLDEITEGGTL